MRNLKTIKEMVKNALTKTGKEGGEKTMAVRDIFVKVARTGGNAIEVCLNGSHLVEDAIEASGLNIKASEEIRVNGEEAEFDTELRDGDRVVLVKQIEGGF